MASSKQLRENTNQHKPKNIYSKENDKQIIKAQSDVEDYLIGRFDDYFTEEKGYYIDFSLSISFELMYSFIKEQKLRFEFDTQFRDRTIKPDGGILFLKNRKDKNYQKVLLIAEVKRQGTNDQRIEEGKKKQAQGNAIERLGKNLTGIKAMMNHEKITPFVCFGWGCDFDIGENGSVLPKVSMLNEFYPLNKLHIFKRDGGSAHNFFAPVSMYFRNEEWSKAEMFEIMKEIAETSFRYYMH